jgi:hypothetical protein
MFRSDMYTGLVAAIFGIERSVKIPDKVYSEEIQSVSRCMLPPRQAMQRCVILRSCEKADVGSSIVKCVNRFSRWSLHSNGVMNWAPTVTIWLVNKQRKLAGITGWQQTQQ